MGSVRRQLPQVLHDDVRAPHENVFPHRQRVPGVHHVSHHLLQNGVHLLGHAHRRRLVRQRLRQIQVVVLVEAVEEGVVRRLRLVAQHSVVCLQHLSQPRAATRCSATDRLHDAVLLLQQVRAHLLQLSLNTQVARVQQLLVLTTMHRGENAYSQMLLFP